MATGASFAASKIQVGGDGSQSRAYELLARFESGTDADNTGATIVLNHANDRGLSNTGWTEELLIMHMECIKNG